MAYYAITHISENFLIVCIYYECFIHMDVPSALGDRVTRVSLC